MRATDNEDMKIGRGLVDGIEESLLGQVDISAGVLKGQYVHWI